MLTDMPFKIHTWNILMTIEIASPCLTVNDKNENCRH